MGKLSDLFTQVRRARSGKGIGFVGGKNASAIKPRAAALLVELSSISLGNTEAAIKAGADGLIFAWNGQSSTEAIQKAVKAAQAASEDVLCGLRITDGWQGLTRKSFENFKELGLNFVILPLNAPARLLALRIKDLEPIVSVPMRESELYPTFIRNLSAFENLAALHLDFGLSNEVSSMSIEDVLHYRAVREAVRTPALVNVKGTPNEDDAYTLLTLGIQAVVLAESKDTTTTGQQIQALHDLLEKVYQDDKDLSSLGLSLKTFVE
jgi:2-methylisocitrate lyase-like PEP mutase family enzyme